MLVVFTMFILGGVLLAQVQVNQQRVQRDRAYTQSLAIAEAGLNQYLWMVASGSSSEANSFGIPGASPAQPNKMTFAFLDPYDDSVQGEYTMEIVAPTKDDSHITVTLTGTSHQPVDQSRTVTAHLGRPAFSEYVMLTNDEVRIGGPLDRKWWGKTHSNTGICMETRNISDIISCARATYNGSYGNKPGVWSGYEYIVPVSHPSRSLWQFPVPAVDFGTVTSDFARLNELAQGTAVNLPYSTGTTGFPKPSAHGDTKGWYIQLLPNEKYQIRLVTGEYEAWNHKDGNKVGGYLTTTTDGLADFGISAGAYDYPDDGVIYVNDNVWIEGTNLHGRITIASSGQLNPSGYTQSTSIHVVGDLTYSEKDGTVAVGLIAQKNIEIPVYAPYMKGGQISTMDMEIDGAMIAQNGKEYCSGADVMWAPRRDCLTIFGSVSSYHTPYRTRTGNYGGFENGANEYDAFLLHNPPPHFPTIGTYQILDWRELPATQALTP